MLTKDPETRAAEEALRRNQRTPAQVAGLSAGRPPFSYSVWKRKVRPATPQELVEWEEFLQQRSAERETDIAREAGIAPSEPNE